MSKKNLSSITAALSNEDLNLDTEWTTAAATTNSAIDPSAFDWSSVSTTTSNTSSSALNFGTTTVATSTGGLSSGSVASVGYTTPCISWGGQDYTSGYLTLQDNLGSLITYLKESEIENLLDILIERAVDDQNTLKQIISSIIRSRHFSEEFILKYFDYVEIHDIRCHHASDINSHNYDQLALLIVASRD